MSANYRNPNWLLPNEKNLKQPASGTVTGSGLAEDRKSLYSMNFDGIDSIEIPDTTLVNNFTSVSFSFWVNVTTPTAYDGIVCSRTSSSEYILTYIDNISGSDFKIVIQQKSASGGTHTVTTSATLTAGNWYNIVCTGTVGGKWDLYINGDKTGQVQSSATITAITQGSNFIIGRDPGNAARGLQGKIDEVAIWNKALSATEVAALSTANAPANLMALSAKPFAYYPLGEFAGNSGELGGTPSGQTNSWKFPNQVLKDYVFDFDGSNANITVPDNDTLDLVSTDFSISIWMKPDNTNSALILNKYGTSGNGWGVYYVSDTIRFLGNGAGWVNDVIPSVDSVDKWVNILITYDHSSTTLKGYKNGSEVHSSTTDLGISARNIPLYISSENGASGWSVFDGEMSNIVIWNSDQTSEKDNIYNNGSPATSYTNTPTSWWKLNAATSSYNPATSTWTITDSAGSNNGTSTTLSSTSLIPSDLQFESPYSNFSLDFDSASNNMILLGAAPTLSSTLTISAWVKKSNLVSYPNYAGIFGTRNGSTLNMPYILSGYDTNSPKIRFRICQSDGTSKEVVSSGTQASEVWYHIAGVADGSNITLYINGVAETPVSYDGTIITPTNELVIGAQGTHGSLAAFDFDGKIDEAALWNTALTAAQINQVYNNGRPGDLTSLSPISWSRLGEDAFFVNNNITIPNQISGGPTGTGSGTQTAMLSADAPQSYGGGYGVGLAVTDKIGDAPESTANSISYNMIPDNRHPYTSSYVPAKVDNAFSMNFDGTNHVQTSSITLGSVFTFSCWLNVNSFSLANQCFLSSPNYYQSSFDGNFIIRLNNNTTINFYSYDGNSSSESITCTVPTISTGSWYHFALTNNGTTAQYYWDGSSITTTGVNTKGLDNLTSGLIIGDNITNNNNGFNGKIDEVAVFNYALTAKQIKEDIYNASTTGKTADLSNNSNLTAPVAWYRMGD